MGPTRSRPSDTILDLLRAAGEEGLSARTLISAGEFFGLTENAIRVTLSRLVARGLIESPVRGRYALARQANALNNFVERWRLGELRVRPWRPGEWLFAHPGSALPGTTWALDALGFREIRSGLCARPDNLTLSLDELRALGTHIGLPADTLLFTGRPQGESAGLPWSRAWRPARLDDDYAQTIERLRDSAARLPALPTGEACLESFRLGGEAIHKLAKDPLLPAEFVDVGARLELWKVLSDYEKLGRQIWSAALDELSPTMPIPGLAPPGGAHGANAEPGR
jgi:phenylacetic acid degradation operon negative regulatory protein